MSEPKGFFYYLSESQKKLALEYRGPENHGDPNFAAQDSIEGRTPHQPQGKSSFEADNILEEAKGQPFTTVAVLGQLEDGSIWISGNANAWRNTGSHGACQARGCLRRGKLKCPSFAIACHPNLC